MLVSASNDLVVHVRGAHDQPHLVAAIALRHSTQNILITVCSRMTQMRFIVHGGATRVPLQDVWRGTCRSRKIFFIFSLSFYLQEQMRGKCAFNSNILVGSVTNCYPFIDALLNVFKMELLRTYCRILINASISVGQMHRS